MIRHESGCADCEFPCRYEACPNYSTTIFICDKCKEESDTLYYGANGKELCGRCALGELEEVERLEE